MRHAAVKGPWLPEEDNLLRQLGQVWAKTLGSDCQSYPREGGQAVSREMVESFR